MARRPLQYFCRFAVLARILVLVLFFFALRSIGRALFSHKDITIFGIQVMEGGPPTLYEHYTETGVNKGLEAKENSFFLNGRPITIYSGAIHYFRVHPDLWRDRLRKMRAAGLNTVETYVPWNLHEPQMDVYDFGFGNREMSMFLDIRRYFQIAKEEDLFVIVRPGPYICSEWEFGGLPSYLLRDHSMRVRTSYSGFVTRVKKYFDKLLPVVADLQFELGGPIIAVQVENEYGSFGSSDDNYRDKEYLKFVKTLLDDNKITSLHFTADSPLMYSNKGSIPGVLATANFQARGEEEFLALKQLQPDKPLMVAEFWTGWFDHWIEPMHHKFPLEKYIAAMKMVFRYNASINLYMFHGGTNFGFMNGANALSEFPHYAADVTSYDYDALLTESGDYTPKYYVMKELIKRNYPIKTKLPAKPLQSKKVAYPVATVTHYLTLEDLISQVPQGDIDTYEDPVSMEMLNINGGSGQSYGFIIYRKKVQISTGSVLKIMGHVRDMAYLMIDGMLKSKPLTSTLDLDGFGYWMLKDSEFLFSEGERKDTILDIMVENMGRVNYGLPKDFVQKKGLWEGPVKINSVVQKNWRIIPLEFKSKWVTSLNGWREVDSKLKGPCLVRATFTVDESPEDTFLDMKMDGWMKGVVFVNGFNLGRYFHIGPQRTLYIPAPLLKPGQNQLIIFELYKPQRKIHFSEVPLLGKTELSESSSFPNIQDLLLKTL